MTRTPTLRYRIPSTDAPPTPGAIIMGDGPRVRRAYRVLRAARCRSLPGLGTAVWRVQVEPMPAGRGREEIAAGAPRWAIVWGRRGGRQSLIY